MCGTIGATEGVAAVDARWLAVILSPFVGSFLGVLVRRLPEGQPVAATRSRCEACRRTLTPLELVPIASYLALRGRCRGCGAPIAPMHLGIELAAVAIAGSAAGVAGGSLLWAGCVLGWALLALAWIDWTEFWLPDALTLPLVVAGLAATWLLTPWATSDHAAAAALGYALFRLVAFAYRRLRGIEGLGHGDAKLLAAGGAWLGLAALPIVILGAAVIGLLGAGALRLAGRRLAGTTAIPFGPPLALAIWLAWLLAGADVIGLSG